MLRATHPREHKKKGSHRAALSRLLSGWLDRDDVRGLQALGALRDFELDVRAFGEGAEAIALNRGEVYEHILAALRGDEAEALRVVEPLDGAGLFHGESPFSCC